MTSRIFDGFLLVIPSIFLLQAYRTPEETYDVMGPALWPGLVAGLAIGVALVLLLTKRVGNSEVKPIQPRFWLFCAATVALVVIQSVAVAPFFLVATLFCFGSYLLIAYETSPMRLVLSAAGSIAFCYAVQWLFTTLVQLDLTV